MFLLFKEDAGAHRGGDVPLFICGHPTYTPRHRGQNRRHPPVRTFLADYCERRAQETVNDKL